MNYKQTFILPELHRLPSNEKAKVNKWAQKIRELDNKAKEVKSKLSFREKRLRDINNPPLTKTSWEFFKGLVELRRGVGGGGPGQESRQKGKEVMKLMREVRELKKNYVNLQEQIGDLNFQIRMKFRKYAIHGEVTLGPVKRYAYHKVRPGDRVWYLADDYGFTDRKAFTSETRRLNPGINFNRMYPGQVIKVPLCVDKIKLRAPYAQRKSPQFSSGLGSLGWLWKHGNQGTSNPRSSQLPGVSTAPYLPQPPKLSPPPGSLGWMWQHGNQGPSNPGSPQPSSLSPPPGSPQPPCSSPPPGSLGWMWQQGNQGPSYPGSPQPSSLSPPPGSLQPPCSSPSPGSLGWMWQQGNQGPFNPGSPQPSSLSPPPGSLQPPCSSPSPGSLGWMWQQGNQGPSNTR